MKRWVPPNNGPMMALMNQPLRVAIFADPGLPSRTVSRVLGDGNDGEKTVGRYLFSHHKSRTPARPDGTLDLDTVRGWARDDDVDLLAIVTEIPRRAGRKPKIAALHYGEGLVIISLPALGWQGVTQRLRHVLFDSLDALADQQTPGTDQHTSNSGVVYEQESRSGRSVYITSPWWRPGRLRLVLGMVRTNEPLSAVSKLSGVLAAAAGTGAFGIFYSSIWEMADALPSWRLGLITAMVIVTMVLWLIGANRLWEHSRKLGDLTEAAMYNASTVATLLLSVILLYLVLFIGILIGGIGVIESGFMSSKIGAEASLGNYVDIAWLSASMGTVAGALGSNFDSEDTIRELTHGKRLTQRFKQRQDANENNC